MIKVLYTILLVLIYVFGNAQEFNIEVNINAPALTTADPKVLRTLERSVSEFFNHQKWTNDKFETEERIEGSIQINISQDPSPTTFVGTILISTARPVYNSSYTTSLINHVDNDFKIRYEENAPIRDNSTVFTDNLSSILTYYAHLILGYDYDTFSPNGGDKHFKIAQNIVSNIPQPIADGKNGWTASESSRNRYWIIENILNARFRPYRKAYYEYHRQGLDFMADNALVGKQNMLASLKAIDRVNRSFRNSMLLHMFSNSKRKEILDIYKNSLKPEQREIYNIMSTIDPAQASSLAELR